MGRRSFSGKDEAIDYTIRKAGAVEAFFPTEEGKDVMQ